MHRLICELVSNSNMTYCARYNQAKGTLDSTLGSYVKHMQNSKKQQNAHCSQ